MPQYYSGADPTQAFAAGMMAGYDFIDRIKARNEQVRLAKLREERDVERFGMEKQQFQTSQKLAELQIQDTTADIADEAKVRKYRDERQPVLDAQSDAKYSQDFEEGGLRTKVLRGQIEEREDYKRARTSYGSLIQSIQQQDEAAAAQERQRLSDIAAKQPAAPPAPPTVAKPAPALDLREQQKAIDEEPGLIEGFKQDSARLKQAAEDRGTSGEWSNLARPSKFGSGIATIGGKRVNPEQFRRGTAAADVGGQYIKDRDKVDPADRAALDTTIYNASVEQRDAVNAEMKKLGADPKNATRMRALTAKRVELDTNIDALAKAKAKSVPKDNSFSNNVDGADQAVVDALLSPARMQEKAGVTPELTSQQLRLLETQLGRINNPRNLTKQQAQWLSEAFRGGYINETTYWNWHKYGGPLAPGKPEITKFNDEYGLMVTPGGGMAWVKAPGAGSKKTSEKREAADKMLGMLAEQFESHIVAGTLEDANKGEGRVYAGRLIQAIRANATTLQEKLGVQLKDASGEVTFENLDALDWTDLINIYVNNKAGMEDSTETVNAVDNAENFSNVIPTAPVQ